MTEYSVTWLDYELPTGKKFSVAVCGYSGKIKHMYLGIDTIRRMFIKQVNVEGTSCSSAQHCLALGCPLNKTPREHLVHMLDMHDDEPLDEKTSELWGTESTVDSLVKFAEEMNQALPKELHKDAETEQ